MAGSPRLYHRNYNASDNTYVQNGSAGNIVLSPSDVGFTAQTGYEFVEWNSSRDGSGTTIPVGETSFTDNLYAIWREEAAANVTISYKGSTIATMSASGVKTLLTGDSFCEDDIVVSYTAPTPSLQTKSVTYNPTSSQQTATITADAAYDGLEEVDVTVNAVAPGSAGTPTATKGAVSGNAISVTPSVTNVTGYITGSTITGTAVSVSASELVSGTKSITSSGTTDVTNYANASVAAGSATTPATTITANPSISVSSGGLITATASASQNVTPTVSAGYVSSGTAGTITVSGSNTSQLTTQGAQTIHPSSSDQTIASGKYLIGAQTIKGVTTTNLTAANIKKDVVIEIGDSTDSDCVTSVTGTYEGGGGGGLVLVSNLYAFSTTLSQTPFSTWTPSTTELILVDNSVSKTFTATNLAQNDYFIRYLTDINVAYTNNVPDKGRYIRCIDDRWYYVTKRPSSYQRFVDSDKNEVLIDYLTPLIGVYSYWSSSTATTPSAFNGTLSYGFYPKFSSPTKSSASDPVITVQRHRVATKCQASYFSTAQAALVDQSNSTIKTKIIVYRAPALFNLCGQYDNLIDIWHNGL